jgi:hypothetical protein
MLPSFILRQYIPYGYRPPKLPPSPDWKKIHEEAARKKQGFPIPFASKVREGDTPWKNKKDDPCIGNLPNWAYRYYIGSRYKGSGFAQCRVCGKTFQLKMDSSEAKWTEELQGHTKKDRDVYEQGCAHAMAKVIQLLQADKCCAVCDKKHPGEFWGVPLCIGCKASWMFDVRDWHSVEDALELAISRNMVVLVQQRP